jgi:hypothetical protein
VVGFVLAAAVVVVLAILGVASSSTNYNSGA